jgi:hypothetical protein
LILPPIPLLTSVFVSIIYLLFFGVGGILVLKIARGKNLVYLFTGVFSLLFGVMSAVGVILFSQTPPLSIELPGVILGCLTSACLAIVFKLESN